MKYIKIFNTRQDALDWYDEHPEVGMVLCRVLQDNDIVILRKRDDTDLLIEYNMHIYGNTDNYGFILNPFNSSDTINVFETDAKPPAIDLIEYNMHIYGNTDNYGFILNPFNSSDTITSYEILTEE